MANLIGGRNSDVTPTKKKTNNSFGNFVMQAAGLTPGVLAAKLMVPVVRAATAGYWDSTQALADANKAIVFAQKQRAMDADIVRNNLAETARSNNAQSRAAQIAKFQQSSGAEAAMSTSGLGAASSAYDSIRASIEEADRSIREGWQSAMTNGRIQSNQMAARLDQEDSNLSLLRRERNKLKDSLSPLNVTLGFAYETGKFMLGAYNAGQGLMTAGKMAGVDFSGLIGRGSKGGLLQWMDYGSQMQLASFMNDPTLINGYVKPANLGWSDSWSNNIKPDIVDPDVSTIGDISTRLMSWNDLAYGVGNKMPTMMTDSLLREAEYRRNQYLRMYGVS